MMHAVQMQALAGIPEGLQSLQDNKELQHQLLTMLYTGSSMPVLGAIVILMANLTPSGPGPPDAVGNHLSAALAQVASKT